MCAVLNATVDTRVALTPLLAPLASGTRPRSGTLGREQAASALLAVADILGSMYSSSLYSDDEAAPPTLYQGDPRPWWQPPPQPVSSLPTSLADPTAARRPPVAADEFDTTERADSFARWLDTRIAMLLEAVASTAGRPSAGAVALDVLTTQSRAGAGGNDVDRLRMAAFTFLEALVRLSRPTLALRALETTAGLAEWVLHPHRETEATDRVRRFAVAEGLYATLSRCTATGVALSAEQQTLHKRLQAVLRSGPHGGGGAT